VTLPIVVQINLEKCKLKNFFFSFTLGKGGGGRKFFVEFQSQLASCIQLLHQYINLIGEQISLKQTHKNFVTLLNLMYATV